MKVLTRRRLTLAAAALLTAGSPAALAQKTVNQKALDAYRAESSVTGHECDNILQQQPFNACQANAAAATGRRAQVIYEGLEQALGGPAMAEGRALAASQRAFLRYRDQSCRAAGAAYSGGTAAPAASGACYLLLTRQRVQALHDLYAMQFRQP